MMNRLLAGAFASLLVASAADAKVFEVEDATLKLALLKVGRQVSVDYGLGQAGVYFFRDGTTKIDAGPTDFDLGLGLCRLQTVKGFGWFPAINCKDGE